MAKSEGPPSSPVDWVREQSMQLVLITAGGKKTIAAHKPQHNELRDIVLAAPMTCQLLGELHWGFMGKMDD